MSPAHVIVDVFTDTPLQGNQLAVSEDGPALSDDEKARDLCRIGQPREGPQMPQDSPEHQITFANRHSAGPVVSSHAAGSRWPTTSRLLGRLADGYARDSRREDESAERAGDGD